MTQKPTSIPQINPAYWGFMLGGSVRIPLMLSYSDLLVQPATTIVCTLGSVKGHFQESEWRGVLLSTLLDQITLQPNAQHAQLCAADGYQTSIALDRLRRAALVYERDGQPLTPEDGFPVRLIVPGLYDYKMPKWIQRIELRPHPLAGTWEQNDGAIRAKAWITAPQHRASTQGIVTLTGTAFAGDHAITQIEVAVDDGAWMPITFTPQPPNRLVNWSIDWTPSTSGTFRIQVRATDSAGFANLHSIVVGVQP